MENCHWLCVEVSPILLPFGTLFSLNTWSWLHSFFFPVGFKRINIFLQIKLVFCLFNFSRGHNKVDCCSCSLIWARCQVPLSHAAGSRHRVWVEFIQRLKLVSVLKTFPLSFSFPPSFPLPPSLPPSFTSPPSFFLSGWLVFWYDLPFLKNQFSGGVGRYLVGESWEQISFPFSKVLLDHFVTNNTLLGFLSVIDSELTFKDHF